MSATLKPFVINLNDLKFLLAQINFVPLFDGPTNSNGIVAFDPLTATTDAYSAAGVKLWDHLTGQLTPAAINLGFTTVAELGTGFPQVSAPIGIRDVTGLHNNLFGDQALWGAVDVPFRREVAADYDNYVTTAGADYTPGSGTGTGGFNVTDYMPRIISRTITTGGVNLLTEQVMQGDGVTRTQYVVWDSDRYSSDSGYAALIDASGVDKSKNLDGSYKFLVEGAKIVSPVSTEIQLLDAHGDPIIWSVTSYQTSAVYAVTLATQALFSLGGLFGSSTGGPLVDGGPVYTQPTPGAFVLNSALGNFDADLLAYKQLVDSSGVNFGSLVPNQPIVTTIEQSSGYGLLEQLGHIDFQNPTSGEFFIGSENPGVAPVNSWFGIFGQFFDHGLDKLGAGGNGKITIALDPSDPLYRAPGTNGPTDQGNTKITVTRATIDGTDANGDATYINHTSPFIDQSQTYGSHEQLTNLLRKWVSTDGLADNDPLKTYHAGMELFDGTTLVDAWERRWPDGSTSTVHDTLPTLSELRDHVLDTGRADLTWDDVANLRNRDANGDVIAGNSGSPLLLDMNPRFDLAHLNPNDGKATTDWDVGVTTRVNAAIADLNANAVRHAGTETTDVLGFDSAGNLALTLGTDYTVPGPGGPTLAAGTVLTGASALMLWVDFSSFAIMSPPGSTTNASVGEILMASVGDHYIAGDGRVNENFGLTSIHHVFHEEHNYQVENLKTWIYAHDANNSPADHAGLHEWQVNNHLTTNNTDAAGNYLNADGSVSWDADKMFDATKLVVEMEYQHAAVDQYARTITPRIQEFVGYSTGVDSTISLEYAQVAFRFGHSTIRETIDTIDPSGWMLGHVTRYALEKAFLNPEGYAEEGVAAITLGLSRQQMNEVDEFITPALNQGLLGQPLDLAAINIARGRDMGVPTLNDFREGISLARYTSWDEFGKNMFHTESLVNFIAAYSFGGGDAGVAKAQAILGLFDGSIVEGSAAALGYTAADALAFMLNNATSNGELETARDGFNHIDSWIGGLAEAHVPGGLLGETFDAIFVAQIQSLMDGDRFYYLYRLFGTNLHEEVNNGQFKDIVERNTGLSHLNGSIFAYADKYYDFGRETDGTEYTAAEDLANAVATGHAPNHLYADLINAAGNTKGIFSDGGANTDANGSTISVTGTDFIRAPVTLDYIRDVRPDLHPDQVHPLEGTPTDGADSHEVIVATDNVDYIHARGGDDTVYGEGGDDYIFGDGGIDRLYGGDGNDMLDSGEGPDLVDGGAGKDIIYGRGSGSEVGGFDQLVGGSGNDLLIGGEGIDKLSGGTGDDIIYGDGLTNPEMGNTDPFTHGGDGNDYIDGGASGDLIFGEEGDDYLVGGIDQDLIQGGTGDDIIRPGSPSQASGTTGGPDEVVGDDGQANVSFDLIDLSDYVGNAPGVMIDFATQNNPLVAIDQTSPFPAWFQIEGAIGTQNGDTFIGDSAGDATTTTALAGSNWLIGGSGNDSFQGNGGNDLIVGGSIRLDTLIGKYADAANASGATGALGSTQWLADAMHTGGTGGATDGYDNDAENGYTGASNRATGALGSGLLDNAILGTEMFDKHFTDMLQSRMFKDVVLGDGGTDGTADTVVFSGNLAKYSIEVIEFTDGLGVSQQALKITDNRTAADLVDANGAPLVDANGNPLVNEGTDLLVGIEKAKFADQTVSLIPTPPALDLTGDHQVTTTTTRYRDNFGTASFSNSDGSTPWISAPWVETGDNGNTSSPTAGQITIAGGVLRFGDNDADTGNGTATIQRTTNLAGFTGNATVSYSYNENSFDNGETVTVQFSDDGTFTTGHVQLIQLIDNNSGGGSTSNIALSGALSATSAIRFVVAGTNNNSNNDAVTIDNLRFDTTTSTTVPGALGTGYTASFTENGLSVAIASFPAITDDSITLASAKIVLTNAKAGDALSVASIPGPDLPAGITASISVDGSTITLTGTASLAAYQTAIEAIRFGNSSQNPDTTPRTINVTVNDGLWTSAVATTTVNVTAVNDAPNANPDYIVTNQATVVVSEALLLANDTDVDGPSALDITATSNLSSLTSASLTTNAGSVTIIDPTTGNAGGSLTYTVSDSGLTNATDTATVNLTRVTGANVNTLGGTNNNEILIGGTANEAINGGGGNDTAFGGGGDDTITYSVTTAGGGQNPTVTSGRDFVDGGTNTATGDRFVLNGTNGSETFRIFSNTDDWDAAGPGTGSSAAHAGITGLNADAKIVITRGGTLTSGVLSGNFAVLAELNNIEEITVNTLDVTAQDGNGVPNGGTTGTGSTADTISVIGNFTNTGLAYSTITINDSEGGATVDISGLSSEHRIVFNTNANGHVVGDVRPQDVVNHSIGGAVDPSPPTDSDPPGTGDNQNAIDDMDDDQDTGNATPPDQTAGDDAILGDGPNVLGTGANDIIVGTSETKVIYAGAGNDIVTTEDGNVIVSLGEGDDTVISGAGADIVLAGAGADVIDTGSGNDKIWGEDGDDLINAGSGDDLIWTGNGENEVHGGAGDDRIETGTGADLLFGGSGNDTFVFHSLETANGDIVSDFEAGDRIDLHFMDADQSTPGNDGFHLAAGATFTGSGELIVKYDGDQNLTFITGNSSGDATPEFQITVSGNHENELKTGGIIF